jgi:hypothetical protein
MLERRQCAMTAIAATAAALAAPAPAADVGVSLSIGQPGFYGRIDIGHDPRPPVLYAEPVVIHRAPVGVVHRPLYLHVPPGHAKNWGKHCHKYDACAQPVYFVEGRWYDDVYAPRYRAGPAAYRDDRLYDRDDSDDRGRGNGHGRGRGHDRD